MSDQGNSMKDDGFAQAGSVASSILSDLPGTAQKRAAPPDTPRPTKRAKIGKWDVEFATQNPNSPLTTAPLKTILATDEAWRILTLDQKADLVSMLPDSKHVINGSDGSATISQNFLKYDQNWSHCISRYQEDLSEGRFDPKWISQALSASQKRQNGEFDDFKDQEYEVFWGSKQKLPSNLIAGLSSAIKLETLFQQKVLQVGDIWVLIRKLAGGKGIEPTIVEKEMKVIGVDNKGNPTLSMPPGVHKMTHPEREDIILHRVTGPGNAEKEAAIQHGILNPPNGNGWKTIRVLRNNQDLGCLWDIRQAFHMAEREHDYNASFNGTKGALHRASSQQLAEGFHWPPPCMIPVSDELQLELNLIAAVDCKIYRVDYRVMMPDGIPFPAPNDDYEQTDDAGEASENNAKQWLLKTMDIGLEIFPTAFTRELAGRHGWSFGYAHVGRNALGAQYGTDSHTRYYPDLMPKRNNLDPVRRTYIPVKFENDQKKKLLRLFESNPDFRKQSLEALLSYNPDSSSSQPHQPQPDKSFFTESASYPSASQPHQSRPDEPFFTELASYPSASQPYQSRPDEPFFPESSQALFPTTHPGANQPPQSYNNRDFPTPSLSTESDQASLAFSPDLSSVLDPRLFMVDDSYLF